MQKFTWNIDDSPNFGTPEKAGKMLTCQSVDGGLSAKSISSDNGLIISSSFHKIEFNLSFPSRPIEVWIYNLNGVPIIQKKITGNESFYCKPGYYTVKAFNGKKFIVKKIIV